MANLFRRFRRGDAPNEQTLEQNAREADEVRGEYQRSVANTRRGQLGALRRIFQRSRVDDDFWEELEETLILGDIGGATSAQWVEELREDATGKDAAAIREMLRERMIRGLERPAGVGSLWSAENGLEPVGAPHVILVVGVNGAGKTTSIAKLAHAYQEEGKSVILAAADTFRAAAIEQLQTWGERLQAPVIAHQQGSDPGAVAYDAVEAAISRGADVMLIDTAGRLQTQRNLMAELGKVRRVVESRHQGAPHEVLLVIDATSGQNALSQARQFSDATGVTAVCLAKLDGTSKGGIVFAIAEELDIPVRFAGTGERLGDIAPFDATAFVDALLSED
ncbi:MAG: signal recognition particle-docking protein FtsY [Chloroflexi bacterium]|nr:signal recognition particle-docking protein FtsY [Chloroflexota bacterium]MYF21416.1 signal recognition particle-docking protein FtsY [Chloroflexota bacterium]